MAKLKEEFFKLLPPTIFFFVALHIVMFIHVLMLKGTAIHTSFSTSIAVGALKKLEVYIAPSNLSARDQEKVRNAKRDAAMAIE